MKKNRTLIATLSVALLLSSVAPASAGLGDYMPFFKKSVAQPTLTEKAYGYTVSPVVNATKWTAGQVVRPVSYVWNKLPNTGVSAATVKYAGKAKDGIVYGATTGYAATKNGVTAGFTSAKAHPYITGAALVGIASVAYLYKSGRFSKVTPATTPAANTAGDELLAATLEAQERNACGKCKRQPTQAPVVTPNSAQIEVDAQVAPERKAALEIRVQAERAALDNQDASAVAKIKAHKNYMALGGNFTELNAALRAVGL